MDGSADSAKTVLVVDDIADNILIMSELLKDHYKVKVANDGLKALRIANVDPQPDIILLDVMMPQLDGYEVCRRLKADPMTRDIPVIFLTGKAESIDEQHGLDTGAIDYITKPISPPILLARVRNHLKLKSASDQLRDQNASLEREVQHRTRALRAIQDATIFAMASLAETRDNETGNHIRRTQYYVKALAERLKTHPRFQDYLSEETIDLIFKSAPLHDIGKIGISDAILLKPGPLTPAEFEIMKTHTTLGAQAIAAAQQLLPPGERDFLRHAHEIAIGHQEKWDGSGYPYGLEGDAIPVSARLMAVADVYDALISERVYKNAFSHERAIALIADGRGSHFDPDIVDAFLELANEFEGISQRFKDDPPHAMAVAAD